MDHGAIPVRHNQAAQRFEIEGDESRAVLEYKRLGARIVYLHTGS